MTACYISPNVEDNEFEDMIEELDEVIVTSHSNIIIGGDFNSKAHLWGAEYINRRGDILF